MRRRPTRSTHWLRPNVGASIPHNLVFVDVHVKEGQDPTSKDVRYQQLDFGVAHGVRIESGQQRRWQRLTFTTCDQFWAWFSARHRRNISMWLVGHGIAKTFTLLNGWELVERGFYTLRPRKADCKSSGKDEKRELGETDGLLVDADPPCIFLLYTQTCVIHVVDAQNYGPATVEELAESAGVQLRPRPGPDAKFLMWEDWLSKRCAAVRDWFCGMLKWWRAGEYGTWRHTAGALAMAAYRHAYMHDKILIHDCAEALTLERNALYGGEFRCFYVGQVCDFWDFHQTHTKKPKNGRKWQRLGPVYRYDVNALYPSVMHKGLFPRELACWRDPGSFADVAAWRDKMALIADVLIDSEREAYPYREKGERHFAVGKFWTTLCGPELLRAIDSGHVKAVGRLSAYYQSRLFTGFVEHFMAQKEHAQDDGDALRVRFYKLLLCALSGKWGQKASRWDFTAYGSPPMQWGSWPQVDADTGELTTYRAIAGHVQVQGLDGEALNSFPGIEAYVNAYGRERMREMRDAAGVENLLYQDSDGLHVLEGAVDRLRPFLETFPGEMGKLRLIGRYNEACYRGPHDYVLDGVHVLAGMRADAEQLAGGGYAQDEEPTLRAILLRQPNGVVRIQRIKRNAQGFHPRGIVNPDGSVDPPQVLEGELLFDRDHPDAIPWAPAGTRTGPYQR